jgi:hypothetical protein
VVPLAGKALSNNCHNIMPSLLHATSTVIDTFKLSSSLSELTEPLEATKVRVVHTKCKGINRKEASIKGISEGSASSRTV